MKNKFIVKCNSCNFIVDKGFHTSCPKCSGLLEAIYTLGKVKIHDSSNPYERYLDLLPILDANLLPSTHMTPLIKAKNLGHRFGLDNLYLKDETCNKTKSTKDRMAFVALPYLLEAGVTHFCTSSTGNSSTAYAMHINQFQSMRMSLFTAESFTHRVNYLINSQITHYGMLGASFVDASEYANTFAKQKNLTSEGGFFNLGRREGLKTIWLEIVEQLPVKIDWYVQAVSSAMGVHGVYKAAQEAIAIGLSKSIPKLLCAQQTSCSPMVKAWEEGAENIQPHHIEKNPSGIAEAILRGNPTRAYPHVRKIVIDSGGIMASVTNDEIFFAQNCLREDEGIDACLAASTAIAALRKAALTYPEIKSQTIVVNLSGGMRASQSDSNVNKRLKLLENNEWAEY
jgi:threonine synthase